MTGVPGLVLLGDGGEDQVGAIRAEGEIIADGKGGGSGNGGNGGGKGGR